MEGGITIPRQKEGFLCALNRNPASVVGIFHNWQSCVGIVYLLLQITLSGWPIAAILALISVNCYHADK